MVIEIAKTLHSPVVSLVTKPLEDVRKLTFDPNSSHSVTTIMFSWLYPLAFASNFVMRSVFSRYDELHLKELKSEDTADRTTGSAHKCHN